MFLKLLLFVILCVDFNIVQGQADKKTVSVEPIARRYLFMGDIVEISIFDLAIAEKSKMDFPKMTIIVTIDKTLGYNIDQYFPFYNDKPLYESNASNANRSMVLGPSSASFDVNFTNETLSESASSIMVDLYPNSKSIVTGNKTVTLSTSKINCNSFYTLSFVLSVESPESEGLYKLYLRTDKNMPTRIRVTLPWHNFSVIFLITQIVAHFVVIVAFIIYRGSTYFYHSDYYVGLAMKPAYLLFLFFSERINNQEEERELFRKLIVICSDIICLGMILVHLVRLYSLKRFTRTQVKVFHIFVSMICVHAIIQESEMKENMVYSYMTTFPNLMVIVWSQVHMINARSADPVSLELFERTHDRYHFVYDFCHTIFAAVVCFHLVLASMISLGLPFYLFWVEVAIEGILFVLYLLCVFHPNVKMNVIPDVINISFNLI